MRLTYLLLPEEEVLNLVPKYSAVYLQGRAPPRPRAVEVVDLFTAESLRTLQGVCPSGPIGT
jgi:hypothetical protein